MPLDYNDSFVVCDYKVMKVLAHTKIAGIKSMPVDLNALTDGSDNGKNKLKDMKTLIGNMLRTCVEENGLGLAAPQIGVNKRLFVGVEPSSQQLELFPAATKHSPEHQYASKSQSLLTKDELYPRQITFTTYINPSWTSIVDDGTESQKEGCLSVKTEQPLSISRYRSILASWDEIDFKTNKIIEKRAIKLTDLRARVFMHECEHLNGGNIVETYKRQNNKSNSNKELKKKRI